MKIILSTLLILGALFNFSTIYGQKQKAYVKFSEQPPKKLIKNDIQTTKFFVEYKSKKEATIFLELRKGERIIANTSKTVKSKQTTTTSVTLKTLEKIVPGSDYNYRLYMYTGTVINRKDKIGETILVEKIKISRLY